MTQNKTDVDNAIQEVITAKAVFNQMVGYTCGVFVNLGERPAKDMLTASKLINRLLDDELQEIREA